MVHPVVMPKLGLTMEEGLLASWNVTAGDTVRQGAVLFVVETDKIATEVLAERDLIVETILVAEGDTVPIGTTVATFRTADGSPTGPSPTEDLEVKVTSDPSPSLRAPQVPAEHKTSSDSEARILATPLARRVARQNGVTLDGIAGSGPRNRIKHADVVRHVEAVSAAQSAEVEPVSELGRTRQPTSIERSIARRLTEAKQTIPHFYVMATADVTELLKFRQELKAETNLPKVTVNHLLLLAIIRAFDVMPEFNMIWANDALVTLDLVNVGIAVDTSSGLYAPVLKDLGGRTVGQVVTLADALIERAREGRLEADQLKGGAISISNVGMFGAAFLVPIVNPGQSAILGVGGTSRIFRPDAQGAPALREEIGLTLSCDHRVHSGAAAARFLSIVVSILEAPLRLLLA